MKQRYDRKLETVTYSAGSKLNHPGKLIKAMFLDLIKSKELAWRLFVRDISAQYRQSLFGILWAFFPPVVAGIVFIILQSKKIVNFGETEIPYPVFVLIGTTLWQLFIESLNAPLKSVIMSKPMLTKINFPREALVVSAFYQMVFSLLIKSLIIAGVFLIFKVQITSGLLLAPVAVFTLIFLGMAIGLVLTPIGALYGDIQQGISMFTQFWFFVTPVIYPPPKTFPYTLITTINPVSPVLNGARDLMTKGSLDNIVPFAVVGGLTFLTFFMAWVMYRLSLPIVIERLSS